MRLLICGSVDFTDREWLRAELLRMEREEGPVEMVIHGAAPGADTIAGQEARRLLIPVREEPAEWDIYGRAAGPRRNQLMINKWAPTRGLAFPTARAKGTWNMVRKLKRARVCTRICEVGAAGEKTTTDWEP